MTQEREKELAEKVRDACLQAALQGFETAGMAGLCAEGQLEMTTDAIRSLDIDALLQQIHDEEA